MKEMEALLRGVFLVTAMATPTTVMLKVGFAVVATTRLVTIARSVLMDSMEMQQMVPQMIASCVPVLRLKEEIHLRLETAIVFLGRGLSVPIAPLEGLAPTVNSVKRAFLETQEDVMVFQHLASHVAVMVTLTLVQMVAVTG